MVLILQGVDYLINFEQSRVQALQTQQALDNSKPIKFTATMQKYDGFHFSGILVSVIKNIHMS
ncbi:MAG: hypothetical protein K0R19_1777 [Bacillota bacterium]|jgi:hypothetical protein|nr:hypothetical protein [Bacillota bacterium]